MFVNRKNSWSMYAAISGRNIEFEARYKEYIHNYYIETKTNCMPENV